MAFIETKNIRIAGISACVPKNIVYNKDSNLFTSENELQSYIKSTGVESRRVADETTCSSDLCFAATECLLEKLKWEKDDIDFLLFLSQTPDYIYPATACILQRRLGLSLDCFCMDINLGCPGWVYGMSTLSSLLSQACKSKKGGKKGLLLVGETVNKLRSPYDRVCLISGDAGTCTALEFDENFEHPMIYDLHTDGYSGEAILVPEGGFRNRVTKESLDYKICEDGVSRNGLNTIMDGASVFSFAITKIPKSIKVFMELYNISKDNIDYFLIHQANMLINKKIMKKLDIDENVCPMNLKYFANTSSSAIPLNIVCNLSKTIQYKKILACGFGGGLAWGIMNYTFDNVVIPDLIEI